MPTLDEWKNKVPGYPKVREWMERDASVPTLNAGQLRREIASRWYDPASGEVKLKFDDLDGQVEEEGQDVDIEELDEFTYKVELGGEQVEVPVKVAVRFWLQKGVRATKAWGRGWLAWAFSQAIKGYEDLWCEALEEGWEVAGGCANATDYHEENKDAYGVELYLFFGPSKDVTLSSGGMAVSTYTVKVRSETEDRMAERTQPGKDDVLTSETKEQFKETGAQLNVRPPTQILHAWMGELDRDGANG